LVGPSLHFDEELTSPASTGNATASLASGRLPSGLDVLIPVLDAHQRTPTKEGELEPIAAESLPWATRAPERRKVISLDYS
jgi:hypothetical protein